MKNFKNPCLILIFLLLSYLVTAQITPSRSVQKVIDKLQSDPDFTDTEVPEKWKNESAVILAKSFDYQIKMNAWGALVEKINLHERIKLMDSLALKAFYPENILDYSGLDFSVTSALIGMNIIKPNGEKKSMPIQDFITTRDSTLVKGGNYSILRTSKIHNEISLPELEIGDIVDYFIMCKSASNLATMWHLSPEEYSMTYWLFTGKNFSIVDPLHRTHPVYYTLTDNYPIVKQKMGLYPSTWMRLNARAINGAPMLFPVKKEGDTWYTLSSEGMEKENINLQSNPYRNFPTVKFQTFYLSNKEIKRINFLKFFIKPPKQINYYLDFRHADLLVKEIYKTKSLFDFHLVSETMNYLRNNFKKNVPADTVVKYTCNYLYAHMIEKDSSLFSRNRFILTLSKVLESRKIQHDLIITVPKNISDISDLMMPAEMAFLIRIKGNPDYFVGNNFPAPKFTSIHSDYQGNNAYAISNPKLSSAPVIQRIVIPVDKP
jgi:hypothetical protein